MLRIGLALECLNDGLRGRPGRMNGRYCEEHC